MTTEHDKNFFQPIDDSAHTLVETLHSTINQLASQQEDTLASFIHSLLQQHGFTPQSVEGQPHLIYTTFPAEKTQTLLLFSPCPTHKNPLARWFTFVTRLLTFAVYHKTIRNLEINIAWFIDLGTPNEEHEQGMHWLAKNTKGVQIAGCLYDIPAHETTLPTPYIALGTKGALHVALEVETAANGQHVSIGAILPNAAWRLIWALNSLKDAREEIGIEGFYDTLVPLEDEEIALLQSVLPSEQALRQKLQVHEFLLHLHSFQLFYTYLLLPTCTITGIGSGDTSATFPHEAHANVTIELVPEQEPEDILNKLRKHLDTQGLRDVTINVLIRRSPQHTPLNNAFARNVYKSASIIYGEKLHALPLIPNVEAYYPLQSLLQIPVIYTCTSYTGDELYGDDTVVDETKIQQALTNNIKHLAMIIEGMTDASDRTQ